MRLVAEDRRQETIKVVGTTKDRGNTDPPADERKHGQNHERNNHDHRALMRSAVAAVRIMAIVTVMRVFCLRAAVLAEKGHEPEAEHIERRHGRGDRSEEHTSEL